MGQQQLLLVALSVIIVGLAVIVGVNLFTALGVEGNKQAIIDDITILTSNAYQYYQRPLSMGGGGYSFNNYSIPSLLRSNENAAYTWTNTASTVTLIATSSTNSENTITVVIGTTGKPLGNSWTYTGQFQ